MPLVYELLNISANKKCFEQMLLVKIIFAQYVLPINLDGFRVTQNELTQAIREQVRHDCYTAYTCPKLFEVVILCR
jgi:hypothetical protein